MLFKFKSQEKFEETGLLKCIKSQNVFKLSKSLEEAETLVTGTLSP
jgi:hypothetical protein